MERILKYLNSYFARTYERGSYEIAGGLLFVKGQYTKGQYILLKGSILNDGVHLIEEVVGNAIKLKNATNEKFEGVMYGLAIPRDILEAEKKLIALESKQASGIYQSESFGNYSYSLATNDTGKIMTPFDVVINEIRGYRQMWESSLERAKEVK